MKIAIISPAYPTKDSHSYAFVHVRAQLYQKANAKVKVFVLSKVTGKYTLDNIDIEKNNKSSLRQIIVEFKPDVIAIHYPTYKSISLVKSLRFPKVAWLHGHEILWNFRLGAAKNAIDFLKKRLVVLPRELYQKLCVRQFLLSINTAVFVSDWLRKNAEKQTLAKYRNSVIIANPIDCDLFNYRLRIPDGMAISLRNLDNTKYGIDIAIKAFSGLTNVHLVIVGKGRLVSRYQALIRRLKSNSQIITDTIDHDKLPKYYDKFCIFIAPSRKETQGLAMCEAMATGMPVIAADVGGIPEFVRDGVDGYLFKKNNFKSLAQAVNKLVLNKKQFMEMSQNARNHILQKCSHKLIVNMELEILKGAIINLNRKSN
ncbi:MAG: glycosyltransferase family 4 protein [Mariniphaga sp.]|nr:glycosyltransferase family 4 protein [Mariniphaga sp.]